MTHHNIHRLKFRGPETRPLTFTTAALLVAAFLCVAHRVAAPSGPPLDSAPKKKKLAR